jgi:hypothetical protein
VAFRRHSPAPALLGRFTDQPLGGQLIIVVSQLVKFVVCCDSQGIIKQSANTRRIDHGAILPVLPYLPE